MKPVKWAIALTAAAVYFTIPGYRYYVIGSWVAYKIIHDKPRKYRVVAKESNHYKRLVGMRHE
jgi:hypothetical protein